MSAQHRQATRLPKASEIGADEIILADKQNAVEEILRLTNGRGADLVVEASGAAPAIASSFEVVRRMGRIAQIGLTGKDHVSVPWDKAAWKVCDLYFNMSTGYTCWDRAIGLIASGKMDVAKSSVTCQTRRLGSMFEIIEKQEALKVVSLSRRIT